MSFKYPERERCQAHVLEYMAQFLQTAAWLCMFKPSEPRQGTPIPSSTKGLWILVGSYLHTVVMLLPPDKLSSLWIKKQLTFGIAFVAFLFSSEDGIGEQKPIMEGSKLVRKAGLSEKEEKRREGKGWIAEEYSYMNFLIVRLYERKQCFCPTLEPANGSLPYKMNILFTPHHQWGFKQRSIKLHSLCFHLYFCVPLCLFGGGWTVEEDVGRTIFTPGWTMDSDTGSLHSNAFMCLNSWYVNIWFRGMQQWKTWQPEVGLQHM